MMNNSQEKLHIFASQTKKEIFNGDELKYIILIPLRRAG